MRITVKTAGDALNLIDNRLDRHGDAWIVQDGVEGLYGPTKPRETGEAIPGRDGSYWPSRLTGESRTITIKCAAKRPSSVSLMAFMDRIGRLAYQPVTLIMEDAAGTRTLSGYIADSPSTTLLPSLTACTFTLIVWCPDPNRYGTPVEYAMQSGRILVRNEGAIPSWPTVTATGTSRLTLRLDDRRVTWSGSATQPLRLDFTDMLPNQGTVTYDDAFQIPPGAHTVNVTTDGTDIRMTVRPAWR